ncbi:MAG: alpha/beta hydrolase [Comamonadaceae bacterium]|nr:MAG: alpha/beta hydrolase [Comamonadaceae bacterium]
MTWVLLRGLTREARHWGELPCQLAQALQAPVITLDLPGNGRLNATPSPLSVAGMTRHARQQLQALGVRTPCRLLGMSLGGMVATDWALRHPQEIDRLVLVNSSMRPFSHPAERLRPRNWATLAWLAWRWRDAAFVEAAIHRMTCARAGQRQEDLAAWRHIRHTAPVSVASVLRQLAAAAVFSAGPQPPQCPALLLSGAGDQLVNPVCSERLALAWRAGHRQHPWAGHDLPHDDGAWLAAQIAQWLEGTAAPQALSAS